MSIDSVTKKVYASRDAAPAVLHAKRSAESEDAYPIVVDADGGLLTSGKGVLTSRVVAVSTTAVEVTPTAGTKQVIISNIGDKPIYIGGSTVTSAAYAFAVYPRQAFDLGSIKSSFSFYAICASGDSGSLGIGEYA